MDKQPGHRFPIGCSVQVDQLVQDPYPVYRRLRECEPVSWIASLNMYYATRYEDVARILKDSETFVTGTPGSTVYDTFGEHMMTVEGEKHDRYKSMVRAPFTPRAVRERVEDMIVRRTDALIDVFQDQGAVELRSALASRLPVQMILHLFGFPEEDEKHLRRWYDSFELAMANFTWDAAVRRNARICVDEFHQHLQAGIDRLAGAPDDSILNMLVNPGEGERLTDEEIRRNASIIFFGGISTVEALILNSVYALSQHPAVLERVRQEPALIPAVLEETVRWLSPVQSATRHVTRDVEIAGVRLREGDQINCMLGAANHDPEVFPRPEQFDIERDNLRRHLGFAIGPHHCLGSHLARAEARITLERLIDRLPCWQMDPARNESPQGYEFRQPRALHLTWKTT